MAGLTSTTHTYRSVDGVDIRAEVHAPDDGSGVGRGAVLWFHGGALIGGGRHEIQPELLALAADRGFTLVSAEYRLAPQANVAEIADDVVAALHWLRTAGPEQLGIDPERVMVAG